MADPNTHTEQTPLPAGHDKELGVLKTVLERDEVHQRDIAEVVGMSVGMTNAIVKRLSKKGLLTVRKINNRNIRYAVTPTGVDEIAKRTYRYLKRTIRSVVDYKEAVGQVIKRAAHLGYRTVQLVGQSDVEFIVEHQCAKHGVAFERVEAADAVESGSAAFVLYAEVHAPPTEAAGEGAILADGGDAASDATAYLRTILAGV